MTAMIVRTVNDKEVVIIRPGALGDTLMALPSLVDLGGETAVAFVGRQTGLGFIQPHVHRISDLDGAGWHRLFAEHADNRPLPLHAARLVVAFFGDSDGRIQANLVARYPETPVFVFPFLPREDEQIHVALYIAAQLKTAGLPVDPKRAMDRAAASPLLATDKKRKPPPRLVLPPGSGDQKKNYPPDWWLDLLARLRREYRLRGFQPLVLLGPAEEAIVEEFQERLASVPCQIQLCPDRPLLSRILQEAALYLGHDSGITHLAAMMGTPTVALFRGTSIKQWRPLGPHVAAVETQATQSALLKEVVRAAISVLHESRS